MFATIAVMQLVDRGLVNLDEPLVRYVPEFRMADSVCRDHGADVAQSCFWFAWFKLPQYLHIQACAGLRGGRVRRACTRTPQSHARLHECLLAMTVSRWSKYWCER